MAISSDQPSIFFRSPSDEVVNELKNRPAGKGRVILANAGKTNAKANPYYIIIYGIDAAGNRFPLMGKGPDRIVGPILESTVYRSTARSRSFSNGNFTTKSYSYDYALTQVDLTEAGKYGSLRSVSIKFTLNGFRGIYKGDTEFEKRFAFIENNMAIGKKIIIDYAFVFAENDTHRAPTKPKRFSIYANRDGEKVKAQKTDTDSGLMFQIFKPEYSIGEDGKVSFTIQAVGQGDEALTKNAVVSQQVYTAQWVQQQNTNRPVSLPLTFATQFTQYDVGSTDDITVPVETLTDFLDWETQHYYPPEGIKFGIATDFDIWNGYSYVGRKAPSVDPDGDYSKAGFVTFRLESSMYENSANLDDGDAGWTHVTFCTLQWLCWFFNNALNEGKNKDRGDGKQYILKCDKETTNGNPTIQCKKGVKGILTAHSSQFQLNQGGGDDPESIVEVYLPSADPYTCIFSYNDGNRKTPGTADYVPYRLSDPNFTDPKTVTMRYHSGGAMGEEAPGIYFHVENQEHKTVVKDVTSNANAQQVLSMANGDLSGILINRDVIKQIYQEMKGINRSETGEQGDDISEISIQDFFNKIFNLIKSCSGGNYDLTLLPDPDEQSPDIIRLLLKNKNELNPKNPIKMPIVGKGDGNTLKMIIKSTVPQKSQTAAFVDNTEGPINEGASDYARKGSDQEMSEEEEEYRPSDQPTQFDILYAKYQLLTKKYSSDAVTSLEGLIKKAITKQPAKVKLNSITNLFPLELTLDMLGMSGFKFGDTINTVQLPPKYRTPLGSARICFTTVKIVHSFGESWTTSLETKCRLIPKEKLQEESYQFGDIEVVSQNDLLIADDEFAQQDWRSVPARVVAPDTE